MALEKHTSEPARNLLCDESTNLLGFTIPRETMVDILMRAAHESERLDETHTLCYEINNGLEPGTLAKLQKEMSLRILDVMITDDLDYAGALSTLIQSPIGSSVKKLKILETQLSSGTIIAFRLLSEDARIPEKLRAIFLEAHTWLVSETADYQAIVPRDAEALIQFESELLDALNLLKTIKTTEKH